MTVTGHGDGFGDGLDAGHHPGAFGGELATAPSREACPEREARAQVRRALNAERQRRFRRRRAARRAEAAGHLAQDRYEAGPATVTAGGAGDGDGDGDGAEGRRDAGGAGAGIPPGCGPRGPEEVPPATGERAEREPGADFAVWFAAYPRQEAEVPARHAWMAERELPPIALLLERLAVQRAAKPDAYYWLAPDRYLRERRWRDQPPPAPARTAPPRSLWAQMRALGSDEGRRQRLHEISVAARFDPFAKRGSDG